MEIQALNKPISFPPTNLKVASRYQDINRPVKSIVNGFQINVDKSCQKMTLRYDYLHSVMIVVGALVCTAVVSVISLGCGYGLYKVLSIVGLNKLVSLSIGGLSTALPLFAYFSDPSNPIKDLVNSKDVLLWQQL